MAAVALCRGWAWLRRNFPMNVSRNRLPFALLVLVMIGAGFTLLAAQFVALGEVHAAHAAHTAGFAAPTSSLLTASSAHATSAAFTAITAAAFAAGGVQRGSDNPVLAKATASSAADGLTFTWKARRTILGSAWLFARAGNRGSFTAVRLEMTHNGRDWEFFRRRARNALAKNRSGISGGIAGDR